MNHYEGANDQIASRVESWWGKLKLTPRFNSLITTALNSNDLRVRAAAIDLDLVAMGAVKTPATVERLAQGVQSWSPIATGMGALGAGTSGQSRRRTGAR